MIRLVDVTKVYRRPQSDVHALDGVSLEVQAGEFVAVCGPSGCGKSTLLSVIGALIAPTAGKVWVAGQDVAALSQPARAEFRVRTVGFVFQLFHLLPFLNLVDNVALAAVGPQAGGRDAAADARELLQRFGLGDRLGHHPGELSAGQAQRAAIARALVNGPKVLLADEPTGNLDPTSAAGVLDLLANYRDGGGTVVLATHDPAAAERASRIVRMADGRLLP